VVLAAVTLLTATARTQMVFRLLARMADLRNRSATTDELTGLLNRRVLFCRGARAPGGPGASAPSPADVGPGQVQGGQRQPGPPRGDLLLVQVGARLSEQLRAGDLLVRLGGDEFAVLLNDVKREQAMAVSVKLRAALSKPFDLEEVTVHSTVSIGIALFPDDGQDLSTLLRKADVAMYTDKASGYGHHVYGGDDDANFLYPAAYGRTAADWADQRPVRGALPAQD
jgi:GGDEF domain-containing protein